MSGWTGICFMLHVYEIEEKPLHVYVELRPEELCMFLLAGYGVVDGLDH